MLDPVDPSEIEDSDTYTYKTNIYHFIIDEFYKRFE